MIRALNVLPLVQGRASMKKAQSAEKKKRENTERRSGLYRIAKSPDEDYGRSNALRQFCSERALQRSCFGLLLDLIAHWCPYGEESSLIVIS
jgi:hypothetical protein